MVGRFLQRANKMQKRKGLVLAAMLLVAAAGCGTDDGNLGTLLQECIRDADKEPSEACKAAWRVPIHANPQILPSDFLYRGGVNCENNLATRALRDAQATWMAASYGTEEHTAAYTAYRAEMDAARQAHEKLCSATYSQVAACGGRVSLLGNPSVYLEAATEACIVAYAEQKGFAERLPRWSRCVDGIRLDDATRETVGYLKFEDCITPIAALECGEGGGYDCAARLECLRRYRRDVEREARERRLSEEVMLAAWDVDFLYNLQCESSLFLTEEYKEFVKAQDDGPVVVGW